jgi:UDP-N-acetylbacillosamine N-acetyltransferase
VKKPILIVGAGGHARVVASVLHRAGKWEICGVLDKNLDTMGEVIFCTKVIGSFDDLHAWRQRGVNHAFTAIGDNALRRGMFERLLAEGFDVPTIIHPLASIEFGVKIGAGTIVCAGCIVCVQAEIGENCILNTGAIIDHETVVGSHAHIAPGARLAGRVRVGEGAMLGIGCSVKDKIKIGAFAVIGAGSVVVEDIPDLVVAYGCPARVTNRPIS